MKTDCLAAKLFCFVPLSFQPLSVVQHAGLDFIENIHRDCCLSNAKSRNNQHKTLNIYLCLTFLEQHCFTVTAVLHPWSDIASAPNRDNELLFIAKGHSKPILNAACTSCISKTAHNWPELEQSSENLISIMNALLSPSNSNMFGLVGSLKSQ